MIIDAHHHLWNYSYEEYPWMGKDPGNLGRDYLAGELSLLLDANEVSATVAVQARERFEENHFLLEQAALEPRIKGIVGWIAFREKEGVGMVETLAEEPLFKGVRHILQAEPDMASFIELPAFNAALEAAQHAGLRYDVLIVAEQIQPAVSLADRYPELPMVIDHIAKPRIEGLPDAEWVRGIFELARRPNVCCKLSGMVTEVPAGQWNAELLKPYFETVVEAFGPKRLMFGSDWPVCLQATTYNRWLQTVKGMVSELSESERAWILSGTASAFYALNTE